MNTLGLNVFIAVVGISSGPGFVSGLKEVGLSLFIWGIVATSIPLIIAVYIGHYVFKFHPAILFGACAGVRTTTAALGMIQETAKSKVPALGYGMPYAIGNTLLTIFGMDDRVVPVQESLAILRATRAGRPGGLTELLIDGGDHRCQVGPDKALPPAYHDGLRRWILDRVSAPAT